MRSSLKEKAYTFCQAYVTSKITSLHAEIEKLNEALRSEAKSTAGDKHETGRAMIQLEREKLGKQLLEAEKMKGLFDRIPKESKSTVIGLGSLVKTDKAIYFICISVGKLQTKENEVFCISAKTPIGQLLLGKTAGEVFEFNGNKATILEVR